MKQITLLFIAFHFFGLTTAQTTIQGSVSDRIDPLPWANIYIKNSTIGTVSDEKGNFTLKAKKGDIVAISYAGYKTKEVIIDNQESIAITLENESLDEVVLTAHRITTCKSFSCICHSNYTIEDERNLQHNRSQTTSSIFPNPSSNGIFNLKMANAYKEVQVFVTNMLGQQVQSSIYQNTNNRVTLDLSSLRTGIYLINSVADGKRLPTQKAIRR